MPGFPEVSGYTIERELGKGGMARVYLASDSKLERRVALKILFPSLAEDERTTQRFIKEARTAARLSHPNILVIYDVDERNGLFYMAMEFLEGGNLKELIRTRGALPHDQAVSILLAMAGALEYAHAEGFVHRDVKPENIMFRRTGTPVLVDFGIARAVDSNTRLTSTGMSIGTPHYMSPEQGRGEAVDGRGDFYALGVVFYEMLTGQVPYEAENTVGVIFKHIQESVPHLPASLSRFQAVIDNLMAKTKERRPATVREVEGLLNTVGVGSPKIAEPVKSQTDGPSAPPREAPNRSEPVEKNESPAGRKNLIAALSFVLLVAVVGLIVILSGGKNNPSVSVGGSGPSASVYTPPNNSAPAELPAVKTEDKDKAYRENYDKAAAALKRRDYAAAKSYADAAKTYRETMELGKLIGDIERGADEQQKEAKDRLAAKQAKAQESEKTAAADDLAWKLAAGLNNEEAYKKYLENYPHGRNADQARQVIAAIEGEKISVEARLKAEETWLKAEEERKRMLKQGDIWRDDKSLGIEMSYIPAGGFDMGSNNHQDDEKPAHRVKVDGFWMGTTEVTQGLWQAVMGNNPSRFKNGDNYPVEQVSWNDIQEFISRLNARTGMRFRLSTEAEWEYACRAGTTGERYSDLDDVAWYADNSNGQTHPVKQKRRNGFGLYDILGNVWEWCADLHGPYLGDTQNNPSGPQTGSLRVYRGGSWSDRAGSVRSAYRDYFGPSVRYYSVGFRLARTN